MKITAVHIAVFETPTNTSRFDLEESGPPHRRRWKAVGRERYTEMVHVLRVETDEGIEGICTVGDARYTNMSLNELEALRVLTLGANPLERERLNAKLRAATRTLFVRPGWFGAFDNCLWDIAGKLAGLPVCELIGRARPHCPAYYNFGGPDLEAILADIDRAQDMGFVALKDHFTGPPAPNLELAAAVRQALGDTVDLMHDAAGCAYTRTEALTMGRGLEELNYGWFEEPLPDRDQAGLQQLCQALDIPILAPESLMHDFDLSALWLTSNATDLLRANARHGTTPLLKLAHLAAGHRSLIELNGPGGLFGLVHAHLVCALENTTYYEYFPNGSRDQAGKEIGLLNPPLPQDGCIAPPQQPGWGAEWDWDYFNKKKVADL